MILGDFFSLRLALDELTTWESKPGSLSTIGEFSPSLLESLIPKMSKTGFFEAFLVGMKKLEDAINR
jgi:hypothetical protein